MPPPSARRRWQPSPPPPPTPDQLFVNRIANAQLTECIGVNGVINTYNKYPLRIGIDSDNVNAINGLIKCGVDLNRVLTHPEESLTSSSSGLDYALFRKGKLESGEWVGNLNGNATIIEILSATPYENDKTYNEGEIVSYNSQTYKFNKSIGAAGYGPSTHPDAWTKIGGNPKTKKARYSRKHRGTRKQAKSRKQTRR